MSNYLERMRSVFKRVLYFFYRVIISSKYVLRPIKFQFSWLFRSRELSNFTYELTGKNERYLATLIAYILKIDYKTIVGYMEELKNNDEIKQHIKTIIQSSEFTSTSDQNCKFGKRLGWYVIARAMKPKVIVETGVDKGLGSCVFAYALIKNKEEGYEGYYYGTDINPKAGFLLTGKLKEYGCILYGDSIDSLKNMSEKIDLFINDSDHSEEYEAMEYDAIADKLSKKSIILGDNAHVTDKLLKFSLKNSRNFVYFHEEPKNHWYPGGGIGISIDSSKLN